jgi:hypothetical protein
MNKELYVKDLPAGIFRHLQAYEDVQMDVNIDTTVLKWEKLGLLDGTPEELRHIVAMLLDNTANFLLDEIVGKVNASMAENKAETLIFPMIIRLFNTKRSMNYRDIWEKLVIYIEKHSELFYNPLPEHITDPELWVCENFAAEYNEGEVMNGLMFMPIFERIW